jgi:hypothetical protein
MTTQTEKVGITPAPWRAIQWNCQAATTVVSERPDGNPLVVCECSGHGRYAEASLDDARLIAAAPELLEALERLIAWQRLGHTQKIAEKFGDSYFQTFLKDGTPGVTARIVYEAEDAIRKAKGTL